MTSRDALKQALSDIICAPTKRDRPDAAEKVLAAMEGYFAPTTTPNSVEFKSVIIECGSDAAGWKPHDPDVVELLKAIERRDEAIIAFGADSQQASMAYSTMRGAYRKVRQKYE